MQITNTTDYAHRIIDYLSEKGNLATEAELADNLKIPIRNISKIMIFSCLSCKIQGKKLDFYFTEKRRSI